MKWWTSPTGGPRRTPFLTLGRSAGLAFLSLAMAPPAIVAGVMSSTMRAGVTDRAVRVNNAGLFAAARAETDELHHNCLFEIERNGTVGGPGDYREAAQSEQAPRGIAATNREMRSDL